jgi:acetolactate synthase-1/2/3 large subunit
MPVVADIIVARLLEAGVRTLFGVPGGGSNLDLVEAAGGAGLPFVLTSTETAGALAATAQAEITGRPGACLTTLGPGVTSVVNGVACAYLDRAPLLVFTDSHPVDARRIYEHQRLDQSALLAPITKWSATLTPDTIMQTLERAVSTATLPPPGPVHLDCPGDVASARVGDQVSASGELIAGPPTLDPLFESLLSRARKPLLLVGLGARRQADADAIRTLCERRSVPALVTYKAKGVVPDDHPWFAGVFTNASIERTILDESDLLIGIGLDPVELIPRKWTHPQPVIACGPWHVSDAHVPIGAQLVSDVATAVHALDAHLPASSWDRTQVEQLVDQQRHRILVPANSLTAQLVVQIAAERLAESSRVTVDAGAHMFPVTMLWPVHAANQMLISNGLSTMGFALPAAIGAALLDRDRSVVALTGDGGLLMCAGELLTAARERLRILTIVFSDASLSLIEIKQQARQYRPSGVGLGPVRWPALAESVGVRAFCAATPAELERAIEAALDVDGPTLVEARINSANYREVLDVIRGS